MTPNTGQRGEREFLPRVLTMIEAEATSDGPGREAVMSRLLEIMLIELLRAPQFASSSRGMLSGLTDPPIAAALRAFHSDIQAPWSVAMMAAEARLSRSAFSDRFTSVVGEPAMTYVLNWRMAVARDAPPGTYGLTALRRRPGEDHRGLARPPGQDHPNSVIAGSPRLARGWSRFDRRDPNSPA
jgi:hypothetical protein